MFCIEISNENRTIPIAEIASFCRIREVCGRFVLCDCGEAGILKRLSHSKSVNYVIFMCGRDELFEKVKGLHFDEFCVRVFGSERGLEREIGSLITGRVNLDRPENELRVFFVGDDVIFTRKLFSPERGFEARRATKRPFFSPISLHPKLARAMVNLSRAREMVLDPLCGTGGILIEAGLMGLGIYGNDISRTIVDGCIRNLTHFGIEDFRIYNRDICELDLHNAEAIVTDMPYGKSSFMNHEDLSTLYDRSLGKFHQMLAVGKRAVICTNSLSELRIPSGLRFESVHRVYVHRSMERYVCSFVKL